MASSYPGALDVSFPGYPYVDNTEFILSAYANSWILAIQAIESTLGYGSGSVAANPLYSTVYAGSSPFSTVTARIAHLEAQTIAAISVDTAVGDYKAVAATTTTGNTGKGADAGHTHAGVTSFNGRQGVVTSLASDFGASFTAAGAIIVGTGNGTSEQLAVGAAGTVLTVQAGDPSGLAWAAPQGWLSGDLRFTSANSWTAAWLPADGTVQSRASFPGLVTATTISFTGTVAGNTISGLTTAVTGKLVIGMSIEGPGLGGSVTITNVSSTSIQTSSNPSVGSQTFQVFPYGNGNGSTTFNVIDMRGRVPVGTGGPGTNAQPNLALGASGGEQNHQLSVAELAQHSHGINDPGHAHGGTTSTEIGTHTHNFGGKQYTFAGLFTSTWLSGSGNQAIAIDPNPGTSTSSELDPHTHNVATSAATTGVSTQNTGSNQSHNNMQPYVVGQWLVKT